MLVSNWKTVLTKSWAVWVALLGLITPELLEWIADNAASFPFEDHHKNWLRAACLALIPVVRILQQQALSGPKTPPGPLLRE
jgi:hypothetical protein